jgi:hypothetical protein
MDMKRLNTWERKMMMKICGPMVEKGIWRIRTNHELQEQYRNLDIIANTEKKRLEWTGH